MFFKAILGSVSAVHQIDHLQQSLNDHLQQSLNDHIQQSLNDHFRLFSSIFVEETLMNVILTQVFIIFLK